MEGFKITPHSSSLRCDLSLRFFVRTLYPQVPMGHENVCRISGFLLILDSSLVGPMNLSLFLCCLQLGLDLS